MMRAKEQKRAILASLKWGGRVVGGPVSFILFNIAILDKITWSDKIPFLPPPPKAMMKARSSKNEPFWPH